MLETADKDEVYLYKTPNTKQFNLIYSDMYKKELAYNGSTRMSKNDELKVPNLKFFEEKQFDELANKRIKGTRFQIDQAIETVKFEMNNKGVKAVVIACNTSSAQAYDNIKDIYPFPIYPIIQTCAKGIGVNNYKRIGVFATEATVKSSKYTEELKKHNTNILVKEIASRNWVGIVEKTSKNIKDDIAHIKDEIEEMLEFKPDKIILGCTHYPYLMDEFVKYAPKELFIDPADIFVKYVKHDLSVNNLLNPNINDSTEDFFVSANPKEFVENGKIFYDIKKLPNVIQLD